MEKIALRITDTERMQRDRKHCIGRTLPKRPGGTAQRVTHHLDPRLVKCVQVSVGAADKKRSVIYGRR